MGYKKKLYAFKPNSDPIQVETHRTKTMLRKEPCDPKSIERGVRQLLADKVSGTFMGIWLLIPEHLRLGTWDLLCGWSKQPTAHIEPRLALQLVNEAALCVTGVRQSRTLSQKGFEIANGLPFVATDQAIHDLLNAHTVADAQALQVALGQLRRASGHYKGKLLAIDPHHMRSYSKRQTRRQRKNQTEKPFKTSQTFFCLDADTHQPVAFTIGSSARTVTQATPELLCLTEAILKSKKGEALILADTEYYNAELFEHVNEKTTYDLLVPMRQLKSIIKKMNSIPSEQFTPRWAGLATAKLPYKFTNSDTQPLYQMIQRCGERAGDYQFKGFLSNCDRDELNALCFDYPKRWHVEEFFLLNQALGWKRAGTLNLNIRYGQMTMALIAQTVIHQLRQRIGEPYDSWDAGHLAKHLFNGLEGDLRVYDDTIMVTFYNAPNTEILRLHYENLPAKLEKLNIDPHIPWLYGFKLDFRFK